jgi:hypothetical protein
MNRRSFWVGILLGGWAALTVVLLLPYLGVRTAQADPPGPPNVPNGSGQTPFGPNGPRLPGPTINPANAPPEPKGYANAGGGTSDSNRTAIALSASIGGGESAVYYFDTEHQRLLVYRYENGSKGGLKLMAARHIDFDLKLEAYRDLSEKSRAELKEAYESAYAAEKSDVKGGFPTKKVDVPGGLK